MRILIVEDDPVIASGLQSTLKAQGCAADVAGSVASAWALLRMESFDAVLLDLGLPDGDGSELLRRIRQSRAPSDPLPVPHLPVLIMSARDGVPDRIQGLDSGADDYLVKPFDVHELMARVRAAWRRSAGRASPLIEHGPLAMDPASRSVTLHGQPVALGVREFTLLQTLLQHRGQVLDRAKLEATLYGFGEGLESNAIEVHIHHLRRKLGEGLIKTMRGVGYFIPRDPSALP